MLKKEGHLKYYQSSPVMSSRCQNSQLIQHISIEMVNLHSDIFNLNGILHTFDLSYFNQQVYQVKE